MPRPPRSTLFPYTTLFRSLLPEIIRHLDEPLADASVIPNYLVARLAREFVTVALTGIGGDEHELTRSEEHTSELQSLTKLVCRLLLEKTNNYQYRHAGLHF